MRRRVDIAVWAALAVSSCRSRWHLPLIRAGAAYSGAFWSPPQWVNIPDFYSDLLTPAVVPVGRHPRSLGGVHAMALRPAMRPTGRTSGTTRVLPPARACGGARLRASFRSVCVVLAKVVTGAFVNRYALPAVIGFAVLAGFGTAIAFRRSAAMRLVVAVVPHRVVCAEPGARVHRADRALAARRARLRSIGRLNGSPAGTRQLPVVVADAADVHRAVPLRLAPDPVAHRVPGRSGPRAEAPRTQQRRAGDARPARPVVPHERRGVRALHGGALPRFWCMATSCGWRS